MQKRHGASSNGGTRRRESMHLTRGATSPGTSIGNWTESTVGLFRQESIRTGPAGTLRNLFADLREVTRGEIIAENPERHLQGMRLSIDRSQGHGTWELYRLDQDFYVVAMKGDYDTTRVEAVPGEGLIEFHLRLSGVLEMTLPGRRDVVTVAGPCLLMMHQPIGVGVSERLLPRSHDASVTLYCRRQILSELARRSGIERWSLLEEIDGSRPDRVWCRQVELSPTLLYIGSSLLESPYRRGIRLLHVEAKALELLCEVLAMAEQPNDEARRRVLSQGEIRQVEYARRLLASNLTSPQRIRDIARATGMSESKLKRAFKSRFGITMFEYTLDRRMRHALEMLRCKRMSVGQVAYAVGYRHQTSFASAFHDFFGFLPSKARTQMH
jgi:AraC-like DNA-binding protein